MKIRCPRCGKVIDIGEVETFTTRVVISNEVNQYRDEATIKRHMKNRLANDLAEFLLERIAYSEYQDTPLNGIVFEARIKVVKEV